MEITGIKSGHLAKSQKVKKASSRKDWKLSDSLWEKIIEYAREDAPQNVYMGNKFLALRKSEVAKVAPDRAVLMGKVCRFGRASNKVHCSAKKRVYCIQYTRVNGLDGNFDDGNGSWNSRSVSTSLPTRMLQVA